jgi:hypothetical protein
MFPSPSAAELPSVEDLVGLTVRCDPSCNCPLHHFSETAEQADHPICFRGTVRRFTLLAQQNAFWGLPRAWVESCPYAPLYESYDTVLRPSPQQPQCFEADPVYTGGLVDRLCEQSFVDLFGTDARTRTWDLNAFVVDSLRWECLCHKDLFFLFGCGRDLVRPAVKAFDLDRWGVRWHLRLGVSERLPAS